MLQHGLTMEGHYVGSRKRKWTTAEGEAKEAWIVDYVDGGGRHIETFAKKKDADARHAVVKVDISTGVHVASKLTVAEAGAQWLDHAKAGVGRGDDGPLERATTRGYEDMLKRHIVPLIGKTPLANINADAVKLFEKKLLEGKRTRATFKQPSHVWGRSWPMLACAMPCVIARATRSAVAVSRSWKSARTSRRQTKPGRSSMGHPTSGGPFSSLRSSPACAHRSCVACRGRMSISPMARSMSGSVPIASTISAHPDRIGAALGAYAEIRGEHAQGVEAALPERRTEPRLSHRQGQGRGSWQHHSPRPDPAQVASGMVDADGKAKYTGMHCLRHYYASLVHQPRQGRRPRPAAQDRADRLGHSTLAMTMDTYGHLFKGDDAEEMDKAVDRFMAVS